MNWSVRKRKWVALTSMLLLVLAGIVWLNSDGEPPIEIKGDLSAQVVAEIKRVVKSELRRQILPKFSWEDVTALPRTIKVWSRFRFARINAVFIESFAPGDHLAVNVQSGDINHDSRKPQFLSYTLFKATDGWHVLTSHVSQ